MTLARLPLRQAGLLAAVMLLASASVALAVVVLRAGAAVRELLDLSFVIPDPTLSVAVDTAATNLRLAAAVVLAAYARGWPRLRLALDSLLGLLVVLNCLLLGAAAGAYGPRLLEALALHGPVELAGFALAGAAYPAARARQLTLPELVTTAAATTALLLAAAWIETYLSIGADG